MWEKIGVKTVLQPRDTAILEGMTDMGEYEHAVLEMSGNANTISRLDSFRTREWNSFYGDTYFNETLDKAAEEMDTAKRQALVKELGIYVIDEAVFLPLGDPYVVAAWWPWVKNYFGETECGYTNYAGIASNVWIDEKLKAEMGK
jgi:peptide/nickel transport system substrate-binding protein